MKPLNGGNLEQVSSENDEDGEDEDGRIPRRGTSNGEDETTATAVESTRRSSIMNGSLSWNNGVNNNHRSKFNGAHSIGLCACRNGDLNTLAELLNMVSQELAEEEEDEAADHDYDQLNQGHGHVNGTHRSRDQDEKKKKSSKGLKRGKAIDSDAVDPDHHQNRTHDSDPEEEEIEFERIKEKAVIDTLSQLRQYGLIEIQLGSYRNGLHYCVESQSIDCAKLLIEHFSPVILFTVDCDGLSPFHLAVISGNVAMTQLFLDRARLIQWSDSAASRRTSTQTNGHHDPSPADDEEQSPVQDDKYHGQTSVQKLIELPDIELHSSIHWAVVCGEVDCLKVLLSEGRGAGLMGRDIHGATPLHYASAVTQFHSFNSKLASSRRTSIQNPIVSRRRSSLFKSLQESTLNGQASIDETGFDEGDPEFAMFGTRHEKRHKSCQILKLFIETAKSTGDQGDETESRLSSVINARDAEGRTPLIWAASSDHDDAIKLLCNLGEADLRMADNEGLTAFHCAASRGYVQSLEALLDHCSSSDSHEAAKTDDDKTIPTSDMIDILDNLGCSPLFYAVTCGQPDAVRVLLTAGANPSIQDRRGRTAAFCGASKGQLESLKVVASFALQYQPEDLQNSDLRHSESGDPPDEAASRMTELLRRQIQWSGLWTHNYRGDLPIHEAVKSGRRDLVIWFFQQYVQLLTVFYGHLLAQSDDRHPSLPIDENHALDGDEVQPLPRRPSLHLLESSMNRDFERFAQSLLLNIMTGRNLIHVAIQSNPCDIEMIKLLLMNPASFLPPATAPGGALVNSGLSSLASSPIMGTSSCEKRASPYPLLVPPDRLGNFDPSHEHKLQDAMRHFADVNHTITMKDGTRMTCLDLALHRGLRSCGKVLLLYGALPSQRLNTRTRSATTGVLRRVRHLIRKKSSVSPKTPDPSSRGSTIEKPSTFSFPPIVSLSQVTVLTPREAKRSSEHSLPGTAASQDEPPASECGSGWESVRGSNASSGPVSIDQSSVDTDVSLHPIKKLPGESGATHDVIDESNEGQGQGSTETPSDQPDLNGNDLNHHDHNEELTKGKAAPAMTNGHTPGYKRCTCLMNGSQYQTNGQLTKDGLDGHAPDCERRDSMAHPVPLPRLNGKHGVKMTNGHSKPSKKLTSAGSVKSLSQVNGKGSRAQMGRERRISIIQRNIEAASGGTSGLRRRVPAMRPGNGGPPFIDNYDSIYRHDPRGGLGSGTSHIWIFRQERKVFEELEEMKLWQIRSGKMNEATAVKRLAEKFVKRMSEMFGIPVPYFNGPYNYKAYEKYLFGVLRKINARRSSIASLTSEPDLAESPDGEIDPEQELRELAAKKTPTPKTRKNMRYIELQGRRRSKSELGSIVYNDQEALQLFLASRRHGSRATGPRWLQRWASDENLYGSTTQMADDDYLRLPLIGKNDEGSLFLATKSKIKFDTSGVVRGFLSDLDGPTTATPNGTSKPSAKKGKGKTQNGHHSSPMPPRPINSGKILMNTVRTSTEPEGGETSTWSVIDTTTGGQLPVAEAAFVYPLFMLPPLPSSDLIDPGSHHHHHRPPSNATKFTNGTHTEGKLPPFRHRQCFKTKGARRSGKGPRRETPIARRMKKRVEKEVSQRWSQIKAQEQVRLKEQIRLAAQSRVDYEAGGRGTAEDETETDGNLDSDWGRGGLSSVTPEFEILYELGDRSLAEN